MNILVKKILIFTVIMLYSYSSLANTIRLTPYISLYSTTLTGTDASLNADGKLVSNSNMLTGFKMSYALSPAFHIMLDYLTGSVNYDNTQEVIAGDEAYTKTKISTGVRMIVHPRVAFRLLFNMDTEIGFNIDSTNSNKAVLEEESLNYLSIYYDQIVFMGGSIYSGLFVGYEPNAAGSTYFARTGTEYGLFAVLENFRVSYFLRNLTKESDNLKFTESASALELSYTLRF